MKQKYKLLECQKTNLIRFENNFPKTNQKELLEYFLNQTMNFLTNQIINDLNKLSNSTPTIKFSTNYPFSKKQTLFNPTHKQNTKNKNLVIKK